MTTGNNVNLWGMQTAARDGNAVGHFGEGLEEGAHS